VFVIVTVPEAVYTQLSGANVRLVVLSCIEGGTVMVIVTETVAGLPFTLCPVSGSVALTVTVAA
jgi:hypothetical protein